MLVLTVLQFLACRVGMMTVVVSGRGHESLFVKPPMRLPGQREPLGGSAVNKASGFTLFYFWMK